jgi:biopolymer transport protein TolR
MLARARKKRAPMGDMNVVPYIDVMLVLLIIFMITAPMLTQGIDVDLPNVNSSSLDPNLLADNEPFILSVDQEGNFYLSTGASPQQSIADDEIIRQTQIIIESNPLSPILVKADERVAYGRVVVGMSLLQQGGASKIGFLTEPPEISN